MRSAAHHASLSFGAFLLARTLCIDVKLNIPQKAFVDNYIKTKKPMVGVGFREGEG